MAYWPDQACPVNGCSHTLRWASTAGLNHKVGNCLGATNTYGSQVQING